MYAQFGFDFGDGVTKTERQTLTVAEVLTTAILSQQDLEFKNCIITADSAMADPVKRAEWRDKMAKVAMNAQGQVVINVQIKFDSCRIAAWDIREFEFTKGITFNNCHIDEFLGFKKCTISSLGVSKTTIETNVEVEGLINFYVDRCTIGSCAFASNLVNTVSFDESTIRQIFTIFSPFAYPLNEVIIQQCTFDSTSRTEISGHIRTLMIHADTSYGDLKLAATILTALEVSDCHFAKSIMFDAFNTPERATTLRWAQFAGFKITVQDTVNGKNVITQNDYEALLKTYSFFYNVYSKNWQDESQDACYVEMKDMQTRWLELKYRENPMDIDRWLVWSLNVFLREFCSYGTEPVLSIKYSLWVLLIFGLIYFVFPSQPDDINGVKFTHTFYNLASHQEERQRQAYLIEREIAYLSESHNTAPRYVALIGSPFYYGHILLYKIRLWFIRQSGYVQQLQERWRSPELQGTNKFMLIGSAGGYFILLLLLAAGVRMINAAALSLNAFVTLGYGEIQAKGIARYLAVIEGAVGWFLLSIFSVSLISQILQ